MKNYDTAQKSERDLLTAKPDDMLSSGNRESQRSGTKVNEINNSFDDKNKDDDDSFFNLKRNKALQLLKAPEYKFDKKGDEEEGKKIEDKFGGVVVKVPLNPVEIIDKLEHFKHCEKLIKCLKMFCKRISMACQKIYQNKVFENFILLTIILNCVIMAMADPSSTSTKLTYVDYIDYALMGVYTFEMSVKVMGMGFMLNKGAYIRDAWNILDFVIVVSGYLTMMVGAKVNLKVLRSFRVLRPLRTISGVDGLKIVVTSVMASIPMLANTLIIMIFFLLVFAIAGVQIFSGVLTKRCVRLEDGFYDTVDDVICGRAKCPDGYYCASNSFMNPNYGATSFDNIFAAMMIMYQTITLEGWSSIMVLLQAIYGAVVAVYFIPLIFIGSFFFLNLTLAVIKKKFTETLEKKKEAKRKQKKAVLEKEGDEEDNDANSDGGDAYTAKASFFLTMVDAARDRIQDTPEMEMVKYLKYKSEMGFDELLTEEEKFLLININNIAKNDVELAKNFGKAKLELGKKKNIQLTKSTKIPSEGNQNVQLKGIIASSKLAVPRERIKDDLDCYTTRFFKNAITKKGKIIEENYDLEKSFDSIAEDEQNVIKKPTNIEEMFNKEADAQSQNNNNKDSLGRQNSRHDDDNVVEMKDEDDQESEEPQRKEKYHQNLLKNKRKLIVTATPIVFSSFTNVLCVQEEEKQNKIKDEEEMLMKDKLFYEWEKTIKYYSNNQYKSKIEDEIYDQKQLKRSDSISSKSSKSSASSSKLSEKSASKVPPKPSSTEFSLSSSKMAAAGGTATTKTTKNSDSSKTHQNEDEDLTKVKFNMVDKYKKQIIKEAISAHREYNWSGEDVMSVDQYDPDKSNYYCNNLSGIMYWKRGCGGYWDRFTYFFKTVITHSVVENFILVVVIANTVTMLIDRYGITKKESDILSTLNTTFTSIFASEMIMKIIGIGIVDYLKDVMNIADGIVVILSLVEIMFMSGSGSFSAFRAIRIFRTFRVVRVTRLVRAMKKMQDIIKVITDSISSFAYIALVLMLFVFIYALLGMELFGGKFSRFPTGLPRYNFDSFTWAFLTSFQVLSLDNWFDIFYDSQRVTAGWICALYYVSWIFVGNFIFLNLFFAILLDQFSNGTDDDEEINDDDRKSGVSSISKTASGTMSAASRTMGKSDEQEFEEYDFDEHISKKKKVKSKNPLKDNKCEKSLYIFAQKNPFRLFFAKIVKSSVFDNIILIVIILSSVKLVYDTYLFDTPSTAMTVIVSNYLDYVFNGIFILECAMKILSLGFCFNVGTYLRDAWNILDFIIVVSSLIDMSLTSVDISMIKVLRMLRSLRPLRFISHNVNMKMLVKSLMNSIGGIISTLFVILIVFMIFGILGVNLYGGKFQYCTEDMYNTVNSTECAAKSGRWTTYDMNFDNIGNAMVALFIISSKEGWEAVMLQAIDSTAIETGPKYNNNAINCIFFIIFIFIGAFFLINLFVGVIFGEFANEKKKNLKLIYKGELDKKQIKWIEMMRMIQAAQPDYETCSYPRQQWRRKVHWLVSCTPFKLIVMGFIVANMFLLAMTYVGSSDLYNSVLDKINLTFTCVFTIECILKFFAFGFKFFKDAWNVFDLIVVLASFLDIIMEYSMTSNLKFLRIGPQLARVLRVVRVSRMFRLVNKYKGFEALLSVLEFALPALMNVLLLLLIVFFIFAVLAVFLFHKIKEGIIINEYFNFNNFGYSLFTLFKMATGEDWNVLMYDTTRTAKEGCIAGKTCGSKLNILFFLVFIIFVSYIMLNLFILVILEEFDKNYGEAQGLISQFKSDLEALKLHWHKHSVNYGGNKIPERNVFEFFSTLKDKLAIEGHPNQKPEEKDIFIHQTLIKLDMKSDKFGFVHFNEVLFQRLKIKYRTEDVLNKALYKQEIKVLKKIRKVLYVKVKNKNGVIETTKSNTANPFLVMFFAKVSVNKWLEYGKKKIEKREKEAREAEEREIEAKKKAKEAEERMKHEYDLQKAKKKAKKELEEKKTSKPKVQSYKLL